MCVHTIHYKEVNIRVISNFSSTTASCWIVCSHFTIETFGLMLADLQTSLLNMWTQQISDLTRYNNYQSVFLACYIYCMGLL